MSDRDWPTYYAEHRDARRASGRRRYAAHGEEIRAASRAYRAAHKATIALRQHAWYARVRAERLRYQRDYNLTHRAERSARGALRYARLAGALGAHTAREWLEKVALFGGCCAYCGEAKRLTRDHRVPLVRGGTNSIANIVPACLPCNSRKGRRTDAEFLGSKGVKAG